MTRASLLLAAGAGRQPGALSGVEEGRPLMPNKYPGSTLQRSTVRTYNKRAVVACAVLSVVFVAAYGTALQGGSHSRDLKWINAHLDMIGKCLAVSVAAATALTWVAGLLSSAAWPVRGGLCTCLLLFLVFDHGEDFQYHGYYNWLLFLVIFIPLNLVLLGLYLWYSSMKPRNFLLSLLASLAAVALITAIALAHYRHIAFRGFMGRFMQPGCTGKRCPPGSEPNCNVPSSTPWVDLLPPGAQNFWTGSQHCKRVHGFAATFSPEGLLTIRDCPAGQQRTYTPFPSTRMWSTKQKTHVKAAYQTNVLKALKAVPYSKPVLLNGTEAVLASCGSAEHLLMRVQRKMSRSVPEPQLTVYSGSSVTTAGNGRTQKRSSQQQKQLNVLILFIDSLGRRHFFRRMPQSVAALEAMALSGATHLYQFFRYQVVGFNTEPNTHAMYTGTEFSQQQVQPFWHAYRQAGYISGSVYNLCEDWGSEYNNLISRHDHEWVAPFCLPEYHPVTPDGEPYQIFKGAFSILRRCLRGRHVHEYNFDYMRQFMATYDGRSPWLLMSSFHEGHEGTGEVLRTMDGDMATFLRHLTPTQLNRTAVFIMADHGLTMGLNYLFTQSARIEHKLPLLAMLLPPWLQERYPAAAAALRANEQRLTSHYDFHATLHHLLHLGEPQLPAAQQHKQWAASGNASEAVKRGVSLLQEVPAGRSCEQAGVPPAFCTCFLPR